MYDDRQNQQNQAFLNLHLSLIISAAFMIVYHSGPSQGCMIPSPLSSFFLLMVQLFLRNLHKKTQTKESYSWLTCSSAALGKSRTPPLLASFRCHCLANEAFWSNLAGGGSEEENPKDFSSLVLWDWRRWANKGMVGFVHLNEMRIRVSGIWSWGLRLKESLAKGRAVFLFAKGKDSIRLHPLSLSLSLWAQAFLFP